MGLFTSHTAFENAGFSSYVRPTRIASSLMRRTTLNGSFPFVRGVFAMPRTAKCAASFNWYVSRETVPYFSSPSSLDTCFFLLKTTRTSRPFPKDESQRTVGNRVASGVSLIVHHARTSQTQQPNTYTQAYLPQSPRQYPVGGNRQGNISSSAHDIACCAINQKRYAIQQVAIITHT